MTDHASLYHLARLALAPHALHDAHCRLISISENVIFRIDASGGMRYALRLHRPGYHDVAEIGSELAWLDALLTTGLDVPRPLPARDGTRILTLPGTDAPPAMPYCLHGWRHRTHNRHRPGRLPAAGAHYSPAACPQPRMGTPHGLYPQGMDTGHHDRF